MVAVYAGRGLTHQGRRRGHAPRRVNRRRNLARERAARQGETEPRLRQRTRRAVQRLPARSGVLLESEDPSPAVSVPPPPSARLQRAVADPRSRRAPRRRAASRARAALPLTATPAAPQ